LKRGTSAAVAQASALPAILFLLVTRVNTGHSVRVMQVVQAPRRAIRCRRSPNRSELPHACPNAFGFGGGSTRSTPGDNHRRQYRPSNAVERRARDAVHAAQLASRVRRRP
jgi:hypothetical protein